MEIKNKVYVSRRFNCSNVELFNWLVEPDLIAQWFGPKHVSIGSVKTDVRVGGKYSIELIKTENQNFYIEGDYIEINAPNLLVYTFQYNGLPGSSPKGVVRILIEAINNTESLLSLTQDFDFIPSDIEKRTEAWEHMFQKLSGVVSTNVT